MMVSDISADISRRCGDRSKAMTQSCFPHNVNAIHIYGTHFMVSPPLQGVYQAPSMACMHCPSLHCELHPNSTNII
jgi:hypothetical protein